ncbi:hypothetical protein Droror1_Dr00027938 [Drosera rotundifolia]
MELVFDWGICDGLIDALRSSSSWVGVGYAGVRPAAVWSSSWIIVLVRTPLRRWMVSLFEVVEAVGFRDLDVELLVTC